MKTLLALSLLLLASSGVFAAEPTTDDFAAGYSLEVEGTGPMYVLQLPSDVYRTVRRADFGDIRVFNGAGDIVPHSLRMIEADPQTLSRKEALPFFPLYGGSAANHNADLALHVTRNASGTIVDIESAPPANGTAPRVTGYLLDLSGMQKVAKTVRELEFFWRQGRESSMFAVTIQQSDDLERWQTLVSRATLAEMEYAGQKVERRTVQLPHQSMKYLKLIWQESDQPLELSAVNGYSHLIPSRQQREWVDLGRGTAQLADNQTLIEYHGNYHLPVTGAQLHFPEMNAIARLALQSRAGDETSWITRCEQVFYILTLDNTQLQNEPCTFTATSDQKWRLVVKEDGAGLRSGSGIPALQLGLRPSELIFLGRGVPPFLLAYGSGKLAQEDRPSDNQMLVQTMQNEVGNRITGQARLGKKITLGGEEALLPPSPARPWKKWLLWTVLVLGVGLLAVMAKNLIGEMKKEETTKM